MDYSGLWITDEDVAALIAADFYGVTPKGQRLASSADGVILPDDFVLSSASGVGASPPGSVVILVKGAPIANDLLVVSSATTNMLTLRRLGFDDAEGTPPGGTTGATGVQFEVLTVKPQIVRAQRRVVVRYDLTTVTDTSKFERLVALYTIVSLFLNATRSYGTPTGGGGNIDTYAAKLAYWQLELDRELDIVDGDQKWDFGVGGTRVPGLDTGSESEL